MPVKSHVFSLLGLSGKPACASILNYLRNGIIVWRAATGVGSNVPRYSIYWSSNFDGRDGHLLGPVSIATNLDIRDAATIYRGVRAPPSVNNQAC